jgi:hypothetical protein
MSYLNLADLAGLGYMGSAAACGKAPTLGPGEKSQCCPAVGWVVYDSSESEYGLCERARALAPSATPPSGGGSSSAGPLPTDPVARVEEMQRRIDERREKREEDRFERMKQEMQLRFVMGQMQKIQQQEAARIASERAREAARRRAEAKLRAERERRERNKKLMIGGAVAFVAARVFGVI